MKKIMMLLAALFALAGACGGRSVPVEITNDLGAWNIEEIYIDPSGTDLGSNRITDVIEPDEVVSISVPVGTYDILMMDEDGDFYARKNVEIGLEGYQWAVTLADLDWNQR